MKKLSSIDNMPLIESTMSTHKIADNLFIFSGTDNGSSRGGQGRDSENFDKSSNQSTSSRKGGNYQSRGGRNDIDRDGDRKGGRRGGYKHNSKGSSKDSNYDGGKSLVHEDQTNESIASSRVNGQSAKHGAPATGNSDGRGCTSSVGEDSGLSSLSSSDMNKSGISLSSDTKVSLTSAFDLYEKIIEDVDK